MTTIRRFLSPSMAVALLALFVSLSGTAVAAMMIYSSNIADNTVQSRDIRDGSLGVKSRDVRDNSLGLIDLSAAAENALRAPSTPAVLAASTGVPTTDSLAVFGVQFDTEQFDVGAMHVLGSGKLVAPLAGKYLVTAHASWAPNGGGGLRYARIERRDSSDSLLASFYGSDVTGSTTLWSTNELTTVTQMAAGDYVQMVVLQQSGAATDVWPQMSAAWIAP